MKRLLVSLLILVGLVVALGLTVTYGVGWYLAPQDELQKSDAVVAISGGETDSRAKEAVRLYELGWAPKIIFSGAAFDPNAPSNAEAMRQIAIDEGVPENDILLEETSANTAENAQGVAKIVKDRRWEQIILVTSPYHQRRAKILFERALGEGVMVINHSATDEKWRRSRWWGNPYSWQLTLSELQKTLFILFQRQG